MKRTKPAGLAIAASVSAAIVLPFFALPATAGSGGQAAHTVKNFNMPMTWPRVAIGLASKTTSEAILARRIQLQLRGQGVRASDADVRHAAATALNELKARDRGPSKGIIVIHFKKLRATVCVSWGPDKDFCKKNRTTGFKGMTALAR